MSTIINLSSKLRLAPILGQGPGPAALVLEREHKTLVFGGGVFEEGPGLAGVIVAGETFAGFADLALGYAVVAPVFAGLEAAG